MLEEIFLLELTRELSVEVYGLVDGEISFPVVVKALRV